MTSIQETNKEIVRRFNAEFIERHNDDLFDTTIDAAFVNHSAQPGTPAGKRGAWIWFTEMLRGGFPDLRVVIDDQVAEGDLVVTRKTYSGTHRGPFLGIEATEASVRFTVIDIVRLREGRYVEHWANADMLGLMQQLRSA